MSTSRPDKITIPLDEIIPVPVMESNEHTHCFCRKGIQEVKAKLKNTYCGKDVYQWTREIYQECCKCGHRI